VTPTGVALNNSQQAAFDKALEDVAEWGRIGARLNRDPRPNPRAVSIITRYTFDPYSSQFFTSLRRYARAGVHIEGRTAVVWRAPQVVDLNHPQRPKIVLKQCADTTKRRVMHGDREIPQDPADGRQVVRMTLYAGDDGRWRVATVNRLERSC
jgi:hypothetical protein